MKNSNCTSGECAVPNEKNCETSQDCSNDTCCPTEQMMCGLLCAAKEAKHELLKEKMKVRLEAKVGKKLDLIADLSTDILIEMCESKTLCDEKKSKAIQKLSEIIKG